jgi:AraC family ethanolamine operon transcriptional activator
LVETFLMLAQQSGSERLRVEDLCSKLGVSLRKLQNAFKEVHGISPARFMLITRLHNAQLLLSRADQSTRVKEIATSLGFAHLGHFAAYYRRHFGETPLQTLRRSRAGAGSLTTTST